jgi:hypothetical protein
MVNQVQLLRACSRARAGRIVAAVALGFMVSSVDASHAETVVGSGAATIGSFDTERVLCPAGMTASGGGIDLANVLTMSVTSSGPVFDDGGTVQRLISTPNGTQPAPIGWQAAARNESSAQGDLKVAAVCKTAPTVVTVVGSGAATIGSFDSVRVLCPAGMTAIGGGIDLANVLTMTVTSSGPVFDDGGTVQRLISTPNGTQPAPIGWQASARNESSAQGDLKVAAICAPEPEASLLAACAVATLVIVRRRRATPA